MIQHRCLGPLRMAAGHALGALQAVGGGADMGKGAEEGALSLARLLEVLAQVSKVVERERLALATRQG